MSGAKSAKRSRGGPQEKKSREGSGSRDSAVGHEGPRMAGDNDGGGEGTKAIEDDGTEQKIEASRRMTGAKQAGKRG